MESPYENMLDVCVNSAMANMRGMTNEQLEQILNNDARLDAIIQSLPQVRSIPSEREVGITENKTLAEWNIGQEERIEKLRSEVQANYQRAAVLKKEVDELKTKMDGTASGQSLDVTSNLLQVATQEADDDAEHLAKDLYNGTITAELFIRQFHEKKTLYHTRKIKCDRLMDLLSDQQYSQPANRTSINAPATGYPLPAARHNFF